MTRWYRSTGDLLVVALWTVLTTLVALRIGVEQSLVRILFVVPLVLFAPGYAVLSALYPGREPPTIARRGSGTRSDGHERKQAPSTTGSREMSGADDTDATAGIDSLERFSLSVVISLGLVPLIAFVVNYTPYGLRLAPIVLAVGGVTGVLLAIGFVRRVKTPTDRRYRVAPVRGTAALWSRYVVGDERQTGERGPLVPSSNGQRLFNVLLVVSLLTLVGTVGYAAVTPPGDDNGFTEVYLLTQTGDGEYTSEELPRQFTAGESQRLFVALGNHENEDARYSVVVTLGETELSRFETTVAAGETRRVEREITPTQTGDSLPLRFLVYRGDAPKNPSPETAYRTAQLWVSVQ